MCFQVAITELSLHIHCVLLYGVPETIQLLLQVVGVVLCYLYEICRTFFRSPQETHLCAVKFLWKVVRMGPGLQTIQENRFSRSYEDYRLSRPTDGGFMYLVKSTNGTPCLTDLRLYIMGCVGEPAKVFKVINLADQGSLGCHRWWKDFYACPWFWGNGLIS